MSLISLIHRGKSLEQVEKYLDDLKPSRRLKEVLSLPGRAQRKLWEISGKGGFRPLNLEFFVPEDSKPFKPFPFEGKNSLPIFHRFQKVFYKTREGSIGGYNEQPLKRLIGAGYFVLEKSSDEAPGLLVINYLKLPKSKPSSFPKITSNDLFPANFIYGGMMDYLRRVSKDVVIGRAWKKGKATPNYFLLCRPAD